MMQQLLFILSVGTRTNHAFLRVTPPLHRKSLENDLFLGAQQFVASRFGSGRGKTGMNTDVFMRILTMSRHKYAAKNRLGFDSLYLIIGRRLY